MKKSLISSLTVAVMAGLLASPVAQSQDAKMIESAVKYRQGAFSMIGWHIGPLGAMAKGKMDFDAAVFAANAQAIAELAKYPENAFPEGSSSDSVETRAKPEIWSDAAGFGEKLEAFKSASGELASVAAGASSFDDVKAAFGALGKSCKGCHDDYRHKKE